jgi:tetratricopeptide (TPR) repeat protein
MSFLGGAECSTAGNPLTQFTKHVQDDKSLQRDRLVGRGPAGLQEGMRSRGMVGGQDKVRCGLHTPRWRITAHSVKQLMDEFLQQSGQLPQGPAQPFAMEQMRRELDNFQTAPQRSGSPGWAAEFDPGEQARMEAAFPKMGGMRGNGFNPADYARFQQAQRTPSPVVSAPQQMNGYQRPMGMGYSGMGMGMGNMGMMTPTFASQMPQPQTTTQSKGKGRMVELDDENWEAQFAEIDAEGQQSLDDEANAAMEAELNDIDRSVPTEQESETNPYGDFESIWNGIQAEVNSSRQMGENQDFDVNDLGADMHLGDFGEWDGFDGLNTTNAAFRDPQLGDYLFEEDNAFQAVSNPFDEGVRILNEGGNLSLAALAFEAAVQKDPSHVEAWTYLGSAQAQNEKESPAIRALEQALKLDPSNLEALMGLAVSYTNEGYDSTAYRTLERWLSIKYPSIISPADLSTPADIGYSDRHNLHERVTNLFIQAAQLSPSGELMDPDVQVGLGVLFYGDEDYDKAVDCFSAALASTESGTTTQRQQVHLLWNRLGATLANSGRSEEAIDAYSKALTLNPNFVRARYNLGVSCINIGCYPEAAQHLLGALAMHKVVEQEGKEQAREMLGGNGGLGDDDIDRMVDMAQNQSTNLYETLRRVFSQMGRRDLAEMVGPGMNLAGFKGEFEF